MKKVIFALAVLFSFLSANSQADPAFTDKMIVVVDKTKEYYEASEIDKPAAYDKLLLSMRSFRSMTGPTFQAKVIAMLNSPTQMARFSIPNFAGCLASAANNFNQCMNPVYTNGTADIPPANCNTTFQYQIVQCALTHLM